MMGLPPRDGDQQPASVEVSPEALLTLWVAIVAERLGFDEDEAITLGRATTGLTPKASRLADWLKPPVSDDTPNVRDLAVGDRGLVYLFGRELLIERTPQGIRPVIRGGPLDPSRAWRFLDHALADALEPLRAALVELAQAYDHAQLSTVADDLYDSFRPSLPPGARGFGQRGTVDLDLIRSLAEEARS